MEAILKNDRKMPFYQRKKFNPMFFCLCIPLTCIINEKINLPKKIPRHYISARTIHLYTWSQIIHRSVDNDIAILLKNWSDVIRYGSNYCQIRIYFSKMCL